MVATATSKVNGIERDSAIRSASLDPLIPFNTIAARILDKIIKKVMSNAPETTPSTASDLRSNDAPTWMKNRGTKKPNPRLDIFSSSFFS